MLGFDIRINFVCPATQNIPVAPDDVGLVPHKEGDEMAPLWEAKEPYETRGQASKDDSYRREADHGTHAGEASASERDAAQDLSLLPPGRLSGIGSTLPPFNFEYTFDNFIVGSSNKFAHAACLAVADRPAQAYNPLFIYGPSGLGKTHLLYAITNELKKKISNIRVIYIKGEDFTNQMIDSLSRQAMGDFRDKYRSCDVLLIDDIQFIAG
ncbi:MAG: AAA family ATPase, partial [Clostridia bacterium]|nr:AAA family ATPase [Clostridia bacterium]